VKILALFWPMPGIPIPQGPFNDLSLAVRKTSYTKCCGQSDDLVPAKSKAEHSSVFQCWFCRRLEEFWISNEIHASKADITFDREVQLPKFA
jgi:hypothetical protein